MNGEAFQGRTLSFTEKRRGGQAEDCESDTSGRLHRSLWAIDSSTARPCREQISMASGEVDLSVRPDNFHLK